MENKNNKHLAIWSVVLVPLLISGVCFGIGYFIGLSWWITLTIAVFGSSVFLWIKNPRNFLTIFFGEDYPADRTNAKILKYIGIICGSIILLGNLDSLTEANQLSIDTNTLTKKGQLDTRFKDAAILIGDENTATIIAGIYALRQIAKEASIDTTQQHYQKIIADVLVATIREWFALEKDEKDENDSIIPPKKPKIIAQTIIDCFKDSETFEYTHYNLSRLNLTEINFIGINLSGANLEGTNLKGAILGSYSFVVEMMMELGEQQHQMDETRARDGVFYDRISSDLYLYNERSRIVDFMIYKRATANLRHANLKNANLTNAHLPGVNLDHADLSNANLSNTNLIFANLKYASLNFTNMTNAQLNYADFSGADFIDKNWRSGSSEKDTAIFSNTILEGYSYQEIRTNRELTIKRPE